MDGQLPFTATDDVRSALASIGRTEDVTFSPDDRRLAIAGYNAGSVLLIDVAIDFSAGRKSIVLSGGVEFGSPGVREPHGLAFLDSETLLVADRAGTVSVFKVPRAGAGKLTLRAQPMRGDGGFSTLHSPGSVAVVPAGRDRHDILVCNNYVHRVTRHRLNTKAWRLSRSRILLERRLNIPDGVAVSPSRRWIAISNHTTASVLIFRNTWLLNKESRPVGALRKVRCPHGVRFTKDGRFVVVADAGSPAVHVYSAANDEWRGRREPATSFAVMRGETYFRGRASPQEGGPKGVDIDRGSNVLVATCEHMPLAFFDFQALLQR